MLRFAILALLLTVICSKGAPANETIRPLPCRSEVRNGVWYILESIGERSRPDHNPSPQTEALYEEVNTVRNILGVPETLSVIVIDCPLGGHTVRTVKNPLGSYMLYIVESVVPSDEHTRRQVAANEVCLIRLGLASDHNRGSLQHLSSTMVRCRLAVERGRSVTDTEAITQLRRRLPPNDDGQLPPYRPSALGPIQSMENALQAFGRIPQGMIPREARPSLRQAEERLEELRRTFE